MSRIVFDSKDRRFIVIFFIKRKKKRKKERKVEFDQFLSFDFVHSRIILRVKFFSQRKKKKKRSRKSPVFLRFERWWKITLSDESIRARIGNLFDSSVADCDCDEKDPTDDLFVRIRDKKIIAHISVVINAFYSASLLQLHLQRENPCLFVEGPVSYLLSRRADDEVKLEDAAN